MLRALMRKSKLFKVLVYALKPFLKDTPQLSVSNTQKLIVAFIFESLIQRIVVIWDTVKEPLNCCIINKLYKCFHYNTNCF